MMDLLLMDSPVRSVDLSLDPHLLIYLLRTWWKCNGPDQPSTGDIHSSLTNDHVLQRDQWYQWHDWRQRHRHSNNRINNRESKLERNRYPVLCELRWLPIRVRRRTFRIPYPQQARSDRWELHRDSGSLRPNGPRRIPSMRKQPTRNLQAGDLAGKHGNITTKDFTASYLELYLSTDPSSPYFFGNKSVVIHTSNTTRLTCANFTMIASGALTTTTSSPSSETVTSTSTATPSPYTSAASKVAGPSVPRLLVAAVGAMLLW